MLPLYNRFSQFETSYFIDLLTNQAAMANPGLVFDKYPGGWQGTRDISLPDGAKNEFFKKFAEADYGYLKVKLQAFLQRQQDLVNFLCAPGKPSLLPVKTDWRFVSGLGSGHPYETGFIWHRTLGVPYLPGSSVKGMIRAWAEQWCDDCDNETVRRLFGSGPADTDASDSAGGLIVFDALPIKPPKLELDILNPHYQPYYESNGTLPPADYYNPVPIFFLTVAPGQSFRFCLAPRLGTASDDPGQDITKGLSLLQDALEFIGSGGKTAVGYGVMVSPEKRAGKWLNNALEELRNNKDFHGQQEENLWKKALAEKWISAPNNFKPIIRDLIKNKWADFGLNWNNPVGGSAKQAKKILSSRG